MTKNMLDRYQKLEYQCNNCGKIRSVMLPEIIKEECDFTQSGYCESFDVHTCENDELQAIILFVDTNFNVRSQTAIRASYDGFEAVEEKACNESFLIPMPKKSQIVNRKVKTRGQTIKNIMGMKIRDKLRNTCYMIGDIGKGKELTVNSDLNFIEIQINLKDKFAEQLLKKWKDKMKHSKFGTATQNMPFSEPRAWLRNIVDILESTILFNDDMLSYLTGYLDTKLHEHPIKGDLITLKLLLKSMVTIPYTEREHMEKFEAEWSELLPEVTLVEKNSYKIILEESFQNAERSLLILYNDLEKNRTINISYQQFVEMVSLLVEKEFLLIYTVEFGTVKR